MKFLIVGAGGTGGAIAAYLSRPESRSDVSLIARGAHLDAIKKEGLRLTVEDRNKTVLEERSRNVCAFSEDEYIGSGETPDVIFICTKSYSIPEVAPLINRVAGPDTLIIPTLNGIRMNEYVGQYVRSGQIISGCIYINAMKSEPGCITMVGPLFRIVFGSEDELTEETEQRLSELAERMNRCGIRTIFSHNILRDTIRKFSYVSPAGITCLCQKARVGAIQKEGDAREQFVSLIRDLIELAHAMEITFDVDLVQTNLNIVDHLDPDIGTSMQRDVDAGRQNESDVQILFPIRLGERYGAPMAHYRAAAEKLAL